MGNKLFHIKSGMSSHNNASLKICSVLLEAFNMSCGEEGQNPNAAGWLEKYKSNFDADTWPVIGTGKSSVPAWHHNLQNLMLGVSCGLEISEMVPT